MCLILLALDQHPDLSLIVAANRDEFHARPTSPAGFWPEAPELLAGKDLQQGGSWFGVTRSGRIALVTNVRSAEEPRGGTSRGLLVRDYLLDERSTPEADLQRLLAAGDRYPGFNLIAGTAGQLFFGSNRGELRPAPLARGVHGLSNASLDTPWPKVRQGRQGLLERLHIRPVEALERALFAVLADDRQAPDADLPDTGIGLAWERLLSSRFIRGDGYGTRCSTVLTVARNGQVRFVERSFNGAATHTDERRFEWSLPPA